MRATRSAQLELEALDDQQIEDLERMFREAAREVAERIKEHAGPDDNVALQELRSLLDQVQARLGQLGQARDELLAGNIARAADLGVRPWTAAAIGTEAVVSASAAMEISNEAVATVRNFVAADGLQLSDRVWRLDRGARDAVVNSIEQAVIQGHGATQAARELLARGIGVPTDIQAKVKAASATGIAKQTSSALLAGEGGAMDNAMRVFRTEINRAHGLAYQASAARHPDAVGFRYLLSPGHPRPDICDLFAAQNLYGLGPGVYPPDKIGTVWPAHPNTLCYTEVVFADEVSAADKAGKETTMQALDRLSPAQRRGVLGVNKAKAYDAGLLSKGMVRAPWRAVKQRLGARPGDVLPDPGVAPAPKPAAKPKGPPTLDQVLELGDARAKDLLTRAMAQQKPLGEVLPALLHEDLGKVRPLDTPAKIQNGGDGAKLVSAASRMFPDAWTSVADQLGPLHVKRIDQRAWHITLPKEAAGKLVNIPHWGVTQAKGGDGYLVVRDFGSAVHEYTHRLQHALPEIDGYFQALHHRRTAGQPLKKLADLSGPGYGPDEVTREDKYLKPYQGRIYSGPFYLGAHGALEVMTIAFESVLGGDAPNLEGMVAGDREMFNLVLGLLYHHVP